MKLRLPGLLAVFACLQLTEWKPADNPLTTPWTANVRADAALSEYPRPQMVRPRWTNLNGLWDYAIQPKEADRPAKVRWTDPGSLPGRVGAVGSQAAAHARRSASGIGAHSPSRWQRLAHAPPFRRGRLAHRSLGQRKPVGKHEGGYDPFTFDITDALKPGTAPRRKSSIAVWDPTDTELHPRGKQVLDPTGIWYTAVSGIWQTVWLEPVPAAHIARTHHDSRMSTASSCA